MSGRVAVPVSRATVRAVCEVRLRDDLSHLVAPAAFTVAEAHYEPRSLLRAILVDDAPVGVLVVSTDTPAPHLVRFLIDRDHQGHGIGRRAVELLVAELGSEGFALLEVSFVPVAGGAEGFWRACGFADTGRVEDGEPVFPRRLGS